MKPGSSAGTGAAAVTGISGSFSQIPIQTTAGRAGTQPSTAAVSGSNDPAACASAELNVTRVIPTVWLLVDGSGSMSAALDNGLGTSRWQVLRDALMTDGTGLVPMMQSAIAFGLYVYDGGLSLPGMAGPQCPRTVVTQPTLDNAAAMTAAYPVQPTGASTPTHFALLDLEKRIDEAGPSPTGPTYVVLATDGKPNLCDFHDGIPASIATEQEAVTTVQQLADAGTHVFVISMAGNDPELQTHLQAVAAAGGTGTQPFTPTSQADLANALTQIVGQTASCDVRIQGRVEAGRECTGTVTLDGKPLACNDADGYRLKEDRQSLELQGAACSSLQTSAAPKLKASFPCEDVVLL